MKQKILQSECPPGIWNLTSGSSGDIGELALDVFITSINMRNQRLSSRKSFCLNNNKSSD